MKLNEIKREELEKECESRKGVSEWKGNKEFERVVEKEGLKIEKKSYCYRFVVGGKNMDISVSSKSFKISVMSNNVERLLSYKELNDKWNLNKYGIEIKSDGLYSLVGVMKEMVKNSEKKGEWVEKEIKKLEKK